MNLVKLQNLCFPSEEICPDSALYFHEDADTVRLDGYFNLFYLEKWKTYTAAEELVLKFRAAGFSKLQVFCDGNLIAESSLPGIPGEDSLSLHTEELHGRVLYFAFVREPGQKPWELSGALYGGMKASPAPVMIGMDICTFRREAEVARNLRVLKTRLTEGKEEAAEHLRIYVIDNGKTLDGYEPFREIRKTFGDRLEVVPNRNSGGAGGFTCGMLRVLRDRETWGFTHVLLHDDDAVLDPESIVRTCGLLRTLREEWKDAAVGGNFLNADHPARLSSAGEWWDNGVVIHGGLNRDLHDPAACMAEDLTAPGHEYDRYSGWWCCCFPLTTVREDNLPLPLFLHHDDIEFGLRNSSRGVLFLNGIGVWHRIFEHRYPNANLYYDTRNLLIELTRQYGTVSRRNFWKFAVKPMISGALLLNYHSARFVYQGLLDFLKGPDWLYDQDPERLNGVIRSHALKFVTPEEAERTLGREETRRLQNEAEEIRKRYAEEGADYLESRKVRASLLHKLTVNGLLLPPVKEPKLYLASDTPYCLFRRECAVLLDLESGKFAVLRRSRKGILRTLQLAVRAWTAYFVKLPGAVRSWKKGADRLTTRAAWEHYLDRK